MTLIQSGFTGVEQGVGSATQLYLYPNYSAKVEVVGAQDPRVGAALGMLAMPEANPVSESTYLLAFPSRSQGEAADVHAIGTITPSSHEAIASNDTLQRLARLLQPGGDAEQADANMLETFFRVTGCADLDTVWDIQLVAQKAYQHSTQLKPQTAELLIADAMTQEVLAGRDWREVTHVTTMLGNGSPRQRFDLDSFGWPLRQLSGQPANLDKVSRARWTSVDSLAAEVVDARKTSLLFSKLPEIAIEMAQKPPEAYHPDFDDRVLRRELKEKYCTDAAGEVISDPVLFIMDGSSLLSDAARATEVRNFQDEIGQDDKKDDKDYIARVMFENYGPYDQDTTFLYLFDPNASENGEGIGMVRITTSGSDGRGLKTLRDLPKVWGKTAKEAMDKHGINPQEAWDIASLVVDKGSRQGEVLDILHNGLHRMMDENESVSVWTTVLVKKYFKGLTGRHFGIPFKRILDLPNAIHMGEESVPAYLWTDEVDGAMMAINRRAYERQCLGEGLVTYKTADLRRPLDS